MDKQPISKIAVIEDDYSVMMVIKDLLEEAGFGVDTSSDGESGLKKVLAGDYDLVVLDLNLPKVSGLDVCRQLRSSRPNLPIVMLTAKSDEVDVVAGLELGADDYIAKPFSPRELLARIRVRLREKSRKVVEEAMRESSSPRLQSSDSRRQDQVIKVGDLEIDGPRMIITKAGSPVPLTSKEFQLVYLLATAPGRVFSRDDLLREVWGSVAESYKVNVSIMMSRIRKKLEDDQEQPTYIHTVRGVGYKFSELLNVALR